MYLFSPTQVVDFLAIYNSTPLLSDTRGCILEGGNGGAKVKPIVKGEHMFSRTLLSKGAREVKNKPSSPPAHSNGFGSGSKQNKVDLPIPPLFLRFLLLPPRPFHCLYLFRFRRRMLRKSMMVILLLSTRLFLLFQEGSVDVIMAIHCPLAQRCPWFACLSIGCEILQHVHLLGTSPLEQKVIWLLHMLEAFLFLSPY